MSAPVSEIHERLLAAYGPQRWWPADRDPFEIVVGAILTQGTTAAKVEQALDKVRQADLLDPRAMREIDLDELEETVRPAGHARVKAGRLRCFLEYLFAKHDGSLTAMLALPRDALRAELLSINGIGPETADVILLYAAGLPVFIVNAGAHRVWKRHGWVEFDADSTALQEQVESGWTADAPKWNELHLLLDRVSSQHCRSQPQCDGCPLAPLLPEGGPLASEW